VAQYDVRPVVTSVEEAMKSGKVFEIRSRSSLVEESLLWLVTIANAANLVLIEPRSTAGSGGGRGSAQTTGTLAAESSREIGLHRGAGASGGAMLSGHCAAIQIQLAATRPRIAMAARIARRWRPLTRAAILRED